MASEDPAAADRELDLGGLRIRPGIRTLEGPAARLTVEPLVMRLLVQLSRRAGEVVTRHEILENCWGSATVGDDSLNRVVAALRRALAQAGGELAVIDTVPRAGYLLRLSPGPAASPGGRPPPYVQRAIEEGLASIRLGLPEPDHLRLEVLRRAAASEPRNARVWGMLALLCRHAAEYAEPPAASPFLAECEQSADRALSLAPGQEEARAALATVAPLFGRWLEAREQLTAILDGGASFVAAHELAIVEMATGRARAAKSIVDGLLQRDPLAACLHYKSIYQTWSVGDLTAMDHVADRASQLWPLHPAVWTARFWTLAFTGRVHAALRMLNEGTRPHLPPPALGLLRTLARAGAEDDPAGRDAAVEACRRAARTGPTLAVTSLFGLGLLGRVDQQLEVAKAYFLREGPAPVPVSHARDEPSINDQHRRVTQILFTPACAGLRAHPEFSALCDRVGLAAYWRAARLTPDFLAGV
jgi:hypothetical protein